MRKRIMRDILALVVIGLLTGCYQPLPNDKDVNTITFSLLSFWIVSQTAQDFTWYVDATLQSGETLNHFEYLTTPLDVGDHTVTTKFKDGIIPVTHTWNVHVESQNPWWPLN